MPSKLQKAIAAVKDQTSISLAKVKTTSSSGGGGHSSSAAALEVAILKATTHDDAPVSEQHVQQILRLASSSRGHAWACARALGRRISRTRNWAVALKSLLLVLRLFQDGDPHFPKEVLSAMKRGYRILNLSSFSAAGSASWHFTAFVRTLALYLDERLHCFLTGKLVHRHRPAEAPPPLDMKPPVLLDRVSHWQRLLDRAVGTRPTGLAKSNRLVQACLYAVVQESFYLYRDISDGLALLLDSFFHLTHASSARAYEACVKASRQFSELAAFYESCKAAGVGGRTSDYPSVTGMSEDLLDTLHDFLKDQQQQADSNPTPLATTFHGRGTSLEDLIGDVSSDEKPAASDDIDLASVMSDPTSTNCSAPEWLELDDYDGLPRTGWELALLEAATLQSTTDNIDGESSSSPFLASSPHQYNPFLQDHAPPEAFHSTHAFFHATSTSTSGYVQPTFRADLDHGNGNGSPLDLFGTFEGGNGNAHSGVPVSSLSNANPETISNATGTSSPLDQFATLTIGSII